MAEKDYKSILAGKAPRLAGDGQPAGLLMDESIIDLPGGLVDGVASSGSSDGDAERFDLAGGLGELLDGDSDGDVAAPSDSDDIPEEEPGPLLPPLAPAGDLPPVPGPDAYLPPLPPPDGLPPADNVADLPPADDLDGVLPAEVVLRRGRFGCFTITPRQADDKPPFGGYQVRCPWHAFARPEISHRYVY